jgi:prevent-host-death family protein
MLEISAIEAQHQFSELLLRVEQGEEIFIIRNGKPVAVIITPEKKSHPATNPFAAWRSLAGSIKKTTPDELIQWVKNDRP